MIPEPEAGGRGHSKLEIRDWNSKPSLAFLSSFGSFAHERYCRVTEVRNIIQLWRSGVQQLSGLAMRGVPFQVRRKTKREG
jgi:hypothetical protein